MRAAIYCGIFAVPFLVLMVTESLYFPYITGKNFSFRIIVEVMAAAWVVLMLLDARYRPKFSWIAVAGLVFLVVMFFANLFGEYPFKSFWSNFERMEGFVTLVHFYLYFIMVATMVTTEQVWRWLLNTSLGVATLVCFYAFGQMSGAISIAQGGGWRVDSTLGNSTYMAVYMLFHIFIATFLLIRTKSIQMRYLYGVFIALFVFMLLQTGTRGAALGLVMGGMLTALYVAFFAQRHQVLRRVAFGGLLAALLMVGGFVAIRDTPFVQGTPILDRLADIRLSEGGIRFMIWGMALEGAVERPVLGWGQENYSYVFNKHYVPELWRAESWYDRTHNVVLDWLIAGGVLGLLSYLGIFAAALWYLVVMPIRARMRGEDAEAHFTAAEGGLMLGILGAYFVHNLFVFDNIVSYIFFALVLALIHARVGTPLAKLEQWRVDHALVEKVVAPIAAVLLVVVIYFVNVPGILAAHDLISALRTTDHEERVAKFEQALSHDSFGEQEVAEQMAEYSLRVTTDQSLSRSEKEDYHEFAEETLLSLIDKKTNDPRFHIFLGGVYRNMGDIEQAADQLARARELSPMKLDIILEQGTFELQRGDTEAARAFFTEAYKLAPEYPRARVIYAGTALYEDADAAFFAELITEPYMRVFATNPVVLYAAQQTGSLAPITTFFEGYITEHPESMTARIAYAHLFYAFGQNSLAIAVLEQAREEVEAFADDASCYINTVRDGRSLGDGCTPY